ncbi:unnamed protein product [Heterosigma akashiwo]
MLRFAICLLLVAAVAAFMPSHMAQRRTMTVQRATEKDLYEAAAACAKGNCDVELVDDLKKLLGERKTLLMTELSKVTSLEKSLDSLTEESELQATIRAIGRLFSVNDDADIWAKDTTGRVGGWTDDPVKSKDLWDYDLTWKNYYAKIEKQVNDN